MSWRELVNWNPESYTQIEQNTQNRESTPQSNSAYIANSAYSISKQNPPILERHLSDLTEEQESIVQSLMRWVGSCQPGDEWQMPLDWLSDSDELRVATDEEVRKRNPALRIWRTGKDKLVCKVWVGAEPSPYRKPPERRKFSGTKRIQTMWSEEHGWCRWDKKLQDYGPDSTLNHLD